MTDIAGSWRVTTDSYSAPFCPWSASYALLTLSRLQIKIRLNGAEHFGDIPTDTPKGAWLVLGDFGRWWQQKPKRHKDVRDFLAKLGKCWEPGWSPRQESNLYLALRRRLFYPLNYGESHIRAFAQEMANRTAVWTARRV
ncbi:hypothetical protein BO443_10829 [Burkholderia orbicola]